MTFMVMLHMEKPMWITDTWIISSGSRAIHELRKPEFCYHTSMYKSHSFQFSYQVIRVQ